MTACTEAPCDRSVEAHEATPLVAARCNGVSPLALGSETSALWSSNRAATRWKPWRAATCNAVSPVLSLAQLIHCSTGGTEPELADAAADSSRRTRSAAALPTRAAECSGRAPSTNERYVGLAPLAIKSRVQLALRPAAQCNGVSSHLSRTLVTARPNLNKSAVHSWAPSNDAICNGDLPSMLRESIPALCTSNSEIKSRLCWNTA